MRLFLGGCALCMLAGLTACQSVKPLQWTGYQNLHVVWQGFMPRSVQARLAVYNPNAYALEVKNAQVSFRLGGLNLGDWNLDSARSLPGRDTIYVPVTVLLNPKLSIGDLLQVLGKDSLQVQALGHALVGRHGVYLNIPVKLNRSWTLSQ